MSNESQLRHALPRNSLSIQVYNNNHIPAGSRFGKKGGIGFRKTMNNTNIVNQLTVLLQDLHQSRIKQPCALDL